MRKRVAVKAAKDRNVAAKSISLPPDLLKWVDEMADSAGRARSNWIAWALNQMREQGRGGEGGHPPEDRRSGPPPKSPINSKSKTESERKGRK